MTIPLDYFLAIGAIVMLTIGVFLLFMVILRQARIVDSPGQRSDTDLTNMMIMFQTMRDIVSQQKDLAQEFNAAMDRRVKKVRGLMESVIAIQEQLQASKREVDESLASVREQLASIEAQIEGVADGVKKSSKRSGKRKKSSGKPRAAQNDSGRRTVQRRPDRRDKSRDSEFDREDTEPAFEFLSSGDSARPEFDDFLDNWTGFDLASGAEEQVFDETEFDEDQSLTRDAFRSLLDFHASAAPSQAADTAAEADSSGDYEDAPDDTYLSPVQQRIYEYSDAGMKVNEIARELGVGKGEVRLILGLRANQSR